MGNPYAPRRARRANEQVSAKEQFLRRLSALGAEQEQLDEVAANWDNFTDDYTPETRAELISLTDDALRDMLRQVDAEFEIGTKTDEESSLDALTKAVAEAEVVAVDKMGDTVGKLIEWVGGDRARAMAVSNLERGPDGGERKSLLAAVDKVIEGGA